MPVIRPAHLGSICWGTHRPEDLLPAFADTLESLLKLQSRRFKRAEYRKIIQEARKLARDYPAKAEADQMAADMEYSEFMMETLFNAIQEFAPAYCYFGANEGDGADFGFWVLWQSIEHDFDGLKVKDLAEVPKGYRGEVLNVNDHCNAALYVVNSRGKFREIWGVV